MVRPRFHEENDRQLVLCLAMRFAGNRNEEREGFSRISNLFVFITIKGRPQYQSNIKDRRKSLFTSDLVSELQGLQAAVCISLASSMDRQILDARSQ